MRILIVVTSCDSFEGARTGVWLESFAAGYYTCRDAGLEVVVSSPLGGPAPADPASNGRRLPPPIVERYNADPDARADFADTVMLSQTVASDFSGAYYADGAGAHVDLAFDPQSARLIAELGDAGRPCAFVGHATAALLALRLPDGHHAVSGRRLTAPTAGDNLAPGLDRSMIPLESVLTSLGALCTTGPAGAPLLVEHGGWITGQNAASSALVARALVAALS
jgi:putative intracellular protease/amidase